MKRIVMFACPLVMALWGPAAGQSAVFLSEDFESYENVAELEAVWQASDPGKFEIRSSDGQGAGGSDKWIAHADTSSGAYLTRTFDSPMPMDIDNNFHFYTRADSWSNTRSGVWLLAADESAYLFIGTHNSDAVYYRWAFRVLGTIGYTKTQFMPLTNAPGREAGVWTKLAVRQTPYAIFFEINDTPTPSHSIPGQHPPVPYTKVRIGNSAPNRTVEYDNILVWSGTDTSVADWDLY